MSANPGISAGFGCDTAFEGKCPDALTYGDHFFIAPDQSQPRDGSAFAGLLQRGGDPAQVTT
jgi:hypothetical protein